MGQSGSAAAGAVVGQAAAVSVEQQRCSDIVDAVARQELRLRWAAGTRSDGSTVLVTDLAGGWIPPGIAIPGDVELLDPRSFTPGQTLRELLGDTEFDCQFAPGEQLGDTAAATTLQAILDPTVPLDQTAPLAREAVAALADCASNAAPYEKHEFTRRLAQLGTEHMQLAPLIAGLQHILTGEPGASSDC
jgi:Family of unknown function (DUF5632)